MSNVIKLEIENTKQNALAASVFFAMIAGEDAHQSAPKIAKKAATEPKTTAPAEPEPEAQEDVEPQAQETTATQNPDGVPGTVDLSLGLDDDGLPWDSRICSTGKKKLAKKPHTWKLIRGVDKDLVASVKAELSAIDWSQHLGGAPATQDSNAPQQTQDSDNAAAAFGFGGQQQQQPANEPMTNQRFVQLFLKAAESGAQYNGQPLTQAVALEVLGKHGVANPTQIDANPAGAEAAAKELGLI